jgi:site-specific recombinase XerD
MLSVHFFLRNAESVTPDRKCVIYAQLEIDGQTRCTAFSTRLKIPKQHWDAGYIAASYTLAEYLTRSLQQIERKFLDIYDILPVLHPQTPVTYAAIRQMYESESTAKIAKETKKRPPLLYKAVMMQYIAQKRDVEKIGKATLKGYKTRYRNYRRFIFEQNKRKLRIDKVSYSDLQDFKRWLQEQPSIGQNNMNKHLTMFKSVLEFALEKGYIKSMPISNLKLKYEPDKAPCYLSEFHRRKIYDCAIPEFQKLRNIAIFLMHTGFSYTDYQDLADTHLIDGFFKKSRNKTDVFSFPPLLPEAAQIIHEYGSIAALPRPDLSDLNKELKYLGSICGITLESVGFNLSTSVFRETFCSMMENEYLLSNRIIMYMMGHTNPKQLNTYSRVTATRIRHEMGIPVQKKTLDINYLSKVV